MQDQVTELYLGFFGRAPDAVGFGYWTNALANGGATVQGIANGFASTPEFMANYGGLTPVQQVTKIYLNVLNRAPDAGGLAYWTGLLNSGSSIGSVVYGITNAAFAQTGTADGLLVQNKVTVGEYFAITLASNDTAIAATAYNLVTSAPASVVAAEAAITQGSGGTWALTTGIDTLTHGPFANFVGTVTGAAATQTLNAGDTITGVGAGNVLKVVDSSAFGSALTPMSGVALAGVQELQVQAAGAGGASTNNYNVATTTGVTKVTSYNSTQSGTTFSGLAAGATVQVSGSASVATNVTNYSYTSGTTAASVTFAGGVNSQSILAVAGAGPVAMAPTAAVINSIGGVNGTTSAGVAAAETVRFNSAGTNTLTSLTVNATTNLRTNLTANDFSNAGAALVVQGAAGSVNLGNAGVYKTIDASGLTGGVTVNLSTQTTSFKGGQGNDNVTAGAVATVVGATASIDAGTGVDTIAGTLVNAGNAAVFKNFDQIAMANLNATLDASLMTNSTITGVTYAGALGGANAVLNNLVETASGFNVTASVSAGNASTLNFTAGSVSGAADAINYTFAATAAGGNNAGNITHQGIEIVNIASGGATGAANTLAITDNNATTVTITGANAINFQVAAQSLVGTATATALTTIDGSALTGTAAVLTFTDNNPAAAAAVATGLTIKGGAAADSITVFTQSAAGHTNVAQFGADTVNLSAGGNDLVVVGTGLLGAVVGALSQLGTAAVADANAFAFTTITGSTTGDQIQFGAAAAMAAGTAAVNVSLQQSLLGAVNAAVGGNNAVTWFQFANNTYVVANVDNAAGFGAGDTVVQLTGLVDLTTSAAAAGTLTLA